MTLELQYQKETKKVIEKYHKEKGIREEENKKWLDKYDGMLEQCKSQIVQK